MDQEIVILSEVSQTETDKYMISLLSGILKKGTYEHIYQTERVTDIKNKLMVMGVRGEGINWETGIDIYTLLYVKQITNKDLLYSTGNSTPYSVMTYGEKNLKVSGYIYLYSLCCILETNAILQINYVSIKFILKIWSHY